MEGKLEKYYFPLYGTIDSYCTESCQVVYGVMIGSIACQQCTNCKEVDDTEDILGPTWIKCAVLEKARGLELNQKSFQKLRERRNHRSSIQRMGRIINLRTFIEKASKLKPELLDKEVYVVAPNGLKMEPKIKFAKKELGNLDLTKENVEHLIISIND